MLYWRMGFDLVPPIAHDRTPLFPYDRIVMPLRFAPFCLAFGLIASLAVPAHAQDVEQNRQWDQHGPMGHVYSMSRTALPGDGARPMIVLIVNLPPNAEEPEAAAIQGFAAGLIGEECTTLGARPPQRRPDVSVQRYDWQGQARVAWTFTRTCD